MAVKYFRCNAAVQETRANRKISILLTLLRNVQLAIEVCGRMPHRPTLSQPHYVALDSGACAHRGLEDHNSLPDCKNHDYNMTYYKEAFDCQLCGQRQSAKSLSLSWSLLVRADAICERPVTSVAAHICACSEHVRISIANDGVILNLEHSLKHLRDVDAFLALDDGVAYNLPLRLMI
eukprot:6457802-Amphidinium_carterae.1